MSYRFKEFQKAKVLQDSTITYMAKNRVFVSVPFLTDILNGKRTCSKVIANRIVNTLCVNSRLEDYFNEEKNLNEQEEEYEIPRF